MMHSASLSEHNVGRTPAVKLILYILIECQTVSTQKLLILHKLMYSLVQPWCALNILHMWYIENVPCFVSCDGGHFFFSIFNQDQSCAKLRGGGGGGAERRCCGVSRITVLLCPRCSPIHLYSTKSLTQPAPPPSIIGRTHTHIHTHTHTHTPTHTHTSPHTCTHMDRTYCCACVWASGNSRIMNKTCAQCSKCSLINLLLNSPLYGHMYILFILGILRYLIENKCTYKTKTKHLFYCCTRR